MIHVCSLSRLQKIVEDTGARHVVSLIGDEARLERPDCIAPENHLWLRFHDISAPLDGYIMPGEQHVAELLDFVRGWDRQAPLVVHCYMGISRSTATAFTTVCALNPRRDEDSIAQALAARFADRDAEPADRLDRRSFARPRWPHDRRSRNHRPRRPDRGSGTVSSRYRVKKPEAEIIPTGMGVAPAW